jgi:hypothetical protein
MQPARCFRTPAASAYLKSRGVAASRSYLEKVRCYGADDTRDRGPDFWREGLICWYSQQSLDEYAARRLAARVFRQPVPEPPQFRNRRRVAEPA